MMLLMVPLASAAICEDKLIVEDTSCTMLTPSIVCAAGQYTYDILNSTGGSEVSNGSLTQINDTLYSFEFNQSAGEYIVKLCEDSTRELRVVPKEADEMGAIAITLFILAVTIFLTVLPFVKNFSTNQFTNLIVKRCIWCIAMYSMVLNSAIMKSIGEAAAMGFNQEFHFFMVFFGWAGYCMLLFISFKTIVDLTKMWKSKKMKRRTGEDE